MTTTLTAVEQFRADVAEALAAGLATTDALTAFQTIEAIVAIHRAAGNYGAWEHVVDDAALALYRHGSRLRDAEVAAHHAAYAA